MSKRILITGATDGIGLETAKSLKEDGHEVIVHGRNSDKLKKVADELGVKTFRADFSNLNEVKDFANQILENYSEIDVLINNAGVFKTSSPVTSDGYDVRYVVNTFSPYLLTKALLPVMKKGRVINLSSAAQASVDFDSMAGKKGMSDFDAYAQSKLAITMWTRHMAKDLKNSGTTLIAVNPGSFLGTKMVQEGFGRAGNDVNIGVNILKSLSLDSEHESHSGDYFDNDSGRYSSPQADGLDDEKAAKIVKTIEEII